MTFEKIILDWPSYAGEMTREELEAALERLVEQNKLSTRETEQGLCYIKNFPKRKGKWSIFK